MGFLVPDRQDLVLSSAPESEVPLASGPTPGGVPREPGSRSRVVLFSELYWPEDTSTGFFLTGIAEGLAEEREVLVLCAQPT